MSPAIAIGILSGSRRRNARPAAADLTTGALPSWLTLTRASSGTVRTGTSTTVSAAVNVARFFRLLDADAVGLLLELAHTNMCKSSEDPTSADWAAGVTVVTTRPDGTAPDGSATSATKHVVTGGGYSRYQAFGATTGVLEQYTQWHQSIAGTITARWQTGAPTATYSCATAWGQVSGSYTTAGSVHYLTIAVTDAQSLRTWGHQVEAGAFPRSYVPTTLGATATCLGDKLTATGTLSLNGRLELTIEMEPLGSSSEYALNGSTATICYESATYKIEWNTTTRVVTLTVAGSTNTCTLNTWTRNQGVKLCVQVGANAATIVKQQVGGGAVSSLAITGSALGPWTPASLDILCAGTVVQWDAKITKVQMGVAAWAA